MYFFGWVIGMLGVTMYFTGITSDRGEGIFEGMFLIFAGIIIACSNGGWMMERLYLYGYLRHLFDDEQTIKILSKTRTEADDKAIKRFKKLYEEGVVGGLSNALWFKGVVKNNKKRQGGGMNFLKKWWMVLVSSWAGHSSVKISTKPKGDEKWQKRKK